MNVCLLLPGLFLLLCSFSAYRTGSPLNEGIPQNTKLRYAHFDIDISDFPVYNTDLSAVSEDTDTSAWVAEAVDLNDTSGNWLRTDTLVRVKADTFDLMGCIDSDPAGRHITFTPRNGGDRFRLSYSAHIVLSEQYDPRKSYDSSWYRTAVRWDGYTRPTAIHPSARNYFVFPQPAYEADWKKLRRTLSLRDTLVDLSGESPNIATVVYRGKPCVVDVDYLLLKIERLDGGHVVETKYIRIYQDEEV